MKRNSVSLFFCRATAGGAIFSLLFAPAARAQFLPTSASTYDFNNVSNWLGSVLTGTATFSQTPVGPQTITFATAPLITPTFNFTIGGTNRSLSLLGTGSPVTLTLGGDITINSTGASVTIGDSNLSIALGGSNRTFSIASGNTLTLAGVVSGGNGFTVTNGGTLVVTAANTYTGTTTVSNGQLTLKNATGSATGTGNVTVGSGGTLQIGDATAAGSLGGNIANAGSVIFNRTDSFTYAGVISGAGLVNKYGTGTLTLTSDQNYTGATSVYAGTLAFGNGGASGGVASDIAVSSGATLAVSRSDTIGYTNIVSGAGNFVKDGTGKLILGAANTFSGAATINAGTLTIGVANALPAVAATVASGATLDVASNLTLSTLNTAGTTSVAGGKILTLSGGSLTGVVSGTGGLAKTGTNSLTLTSNQAYTGTTTVSDGYLVLGNQTSSGSVAGNIVNNAVLTFARSDSYSYAGVVSGSGVIFQSGGTGSILTLTGVNTYSGTTNISSGTLKLGAVNTLPTATTVSLQAIGTLDVGFNQTVGRLDGLAGSSVILGSGAKLTIAGSSGTQFDGALSGGGALALAGTGPLTLTATNLFSGGITLESGSSLSVSADANLGAVPGSATAGQLTFNGGSLQATASFSLNSNRGIGLGSGGGTIYTATTVSLSYGGIITGTGGLTKSDPGALTLGGASTYTGATLITGGKLLVTNSAGSGTGSGSVTVSSGAIFGGTGTITGPLFLNSGGIVSPGLIPGTLNVGATTFAGGSKFDFKINDATGAVNTSWNLLNISGGLTLTATSGNPFIVNLSSLTLGNLAGTAANFNSSLSYNWQFVTASAGVTGFDATAFQFNTSLFQNSLGTGNFYVSQSGNSLLLNFTPVPEPATWALLALGLSPIVLVLRRRRAFPRS